MITSRFTKVCVIFIIPLRVANYYTGLIAFRLYIICVAAYLFRHFSISQPAHTY